jgi:hypothetical protein
MAVRVAIEEGAKRSFASAVDWPGWSRSGRTPDDAVASLLAYAPRYARVAERAGVSFDPPGSVDELEVVERLPGGSGTDFGVPGAAAAAEDTPVDDAGLERLTVLLRAAWDELDGIADGARGVELRKGPRGGGRDLDKILGHVREAEAAYLGQLGAKPPPGPGAGPIRQAILETLRARVTGRPIESPRRTKRPWSPRYAVRRTVWHVLDHAWEIQDRSKENESG